MPKAFYKKIFIHALNMVIALKLEINVKILTLFNGLPSVVKGDKKCNYCGHYPLATSII